MATGNNLFSNFYELLRYSWQARRKNKSAKDGRYEYQVRLEVIFFFFLKKLQKHIGQYTGASQKEFEDQEVVSAIQ